MGGVSEGNVVEFPGLTTVDIPPDAVLSGAMGKMEYVLLVGIDADGDLYIASSESGAAKANYYLDLAKKYLLD